ncbi:hypothetical protein KOAAANKH_02248 [Brevundimonas sp. NIBR10]|uniref:DUF6249 domain-containing protein n=1 Tax=Brevundimonas sp. NIBR10 TaxID=3015997 RepID=UPI0022F162EE|nr:DUF6249 domain-containing protein [Brevundimonas sp. NIBR10]WGM47372.1 hypothetical protein KOAAANKH_02248 [Brevundimonas sp. NIBR10]
MEELIPIAFFAMIAGIAIVPGYLKHRERKEMQATLRASIEKGQPLPPEVIEALSKEGVKAPPTAHSDLRVGVILLAVSIGVALFGYAFTFISGFEESKVSVPIMGLSAIPGMVGLAFIILSAFNKNKG